jgi:hypothetical protein
MPRHCSALPCRGHYSANSPPLCDVVRRGQQPPRGTVRPTPEKGRRNPRRDDAQLLYARTGRRRDVRPVGAVTSVALGPVRPSPSSRFHPGHCITIPDTMEHAATGHRHAIHSVTYGLPSTAPSSRPAGGGLTSTLYATTLEAVHVWAQDAPRRPARSGIRRTTVYSMALHAMPLHVGKILWHARKLLPPWPIKGGVVPQPRGDDG